MPASSTPRRNPVFLQFILLLASSAFLGLTHVGRRHVKTMMIYTHLLRRGFGIRRAVEAR